VLDHPALATLKDRLTVVSVPSRLWTCGGPQIADALAILAGAAGNAKEEAR
jgi:iron complex transport system substrate-binding protein